MAQAYDFTQKITLALPRDEAIVLLWHLTRELWGNHGGPLSRSFTNDAEAHALEGLLQELIQPLIDTGGENGEAIHAQAVRRVIDRYRAD